MKSDQRLIVAGASGLVGGALVRELKGAGWSVSRLVRRPPHSPDEIFWAPESGQLDPAVIAGAAAVVNLAGENIAGGRWTAARKAAILASRVDATRTLASAIRASASPPRVLINASAVGIYGDTAAPVDEYALLGEGFLAQVCRDWEREAQAVAGPGVRVVCVRLGVVLGTEGGALARMLPVFRLGLGGNLRGRRAVDELDQSARCGRGIRFALETPALVGPVNLVSPEPVTNADFTRALGHVLRRPTFLPVPAAAISLLFGEMGRATLLANSRVLPSRLVEAGFTFRYPSIQSALAQTLSR